MRDKITNDAANEQILPGGNATATSADAPVQLSEKRIGYMLLKGRSLLLVNNLREAHQIAKVVVKSGTNNAEHSPSKTISNKVPSKWMKNPQWSDRNTQTG
jgi:hypothetical protein